MSRPRLLLLLPAAVLLALSSACSSSSSSGSSATPSSSAPPTKSLSPADEKTVDDLAAKALVNGVTGVIVGLDDPARGRLIKAYGKADTAGSPMTSDMHYRIASVTKTFTALAVLQQVQQKKVALTDPISKYLADVPNGDAVTIKDLLGMRSGLYNYTTSQDFLTKYFADPTYPGWKVSDVLAIVRANENDPPDKQTVYDDTNYVLLGEVLAKVSGQDVPSLLTATARSLGLPQTTYPTSDDLPAPFARGYLLSNPPTGNNDPVPDPKVRDVTVSNPEVASTAGAVVSTVPDMLAYAKLLATGAGLDADTFRLRTSWTNIPVPGLTFNYGLGISQLGDWIGHDGSIVGYSTMVFYLPAQKASLVVMVNEADAIRVPANYLWGAIVKAFYPKTF